jgi:uncharacterized protein (UPF0297 family)
MNNDQSTTTFKLPKEMENPVGAIVKLVCDAMREKGYDPINQLVGYITSGDPIYITSHNGARKLISRIDRDELLEEVVGKYIASISKE